MFNPVKERRVELATGSDLPDIGKRFDGDSIGTRLIQPQGVKAEVVESEEETAEREENEGLDVPASGNNRSNICDRKIPERSKRRFVPFIEIALLTAVPDIFRLTPWSDRKSVV